ncbi:MAG TPA: iron ABC transporter substrate-binding protein [Candidatus Limnocylindrales bacterium]|nr:iron ABC transporter substrate-binding protein [Candidatus Limnocylindrales bacterium]
MASPAAPIGGSLTIYSGRSESLVGPLIERFKSQTGIDVQVNYAGTSELASTILEEGQASPADVFFSQDGGALGALGAEGRLAVLPEGVTSLVDARFRSPKGEWVGISGRARVVAYDSRVLAEADLPDSILDYTDPAWKGRIGWAPSNASLQTFVTALRVLEGEDAARSWLEGIQANEPRVYEGNSQALEGVASGEVAVAFINHYYLLEAIAEQGAELPVKNDFLPGGDPGSLVNVAGAGVLTTAKNPAAAIAFIEFLLSEESQTYFAEETFEYPLLEGVPADERLTPLSEIQSPDVDLSDLSDLEGTLELMQEAGVL